MDFLTAELIASYHAVPGLSDRVKAADFDGPHKKNKRPSNHERLPPSHWRQKQRNDSGQREGDVKVVGVCVYVCVCVCVKEEEGGFGGGGMIETSNQPHCREQRAGRGLLPAAKCAGLSLFPLHADQ